MTTDSMIMSECDSQVKVEVKVINKIDNNGLEILETESMGSGTGTESSQDNFHVSVSSVRERVRMMRIRSNSQVGILTSLRLKIADWYACLFRQRRHRSTDINIRFEDQEIELIKDVKPENNGTHHKNGNQSHAFREDNIELPDESKEYLNFGEEDQVEIEGYERSSLKTGVTWVFIFLTVGLLRLVFHWWPQLMLYATHYPCSIAKADKILVTEHYQKKYKRYYVKPVFILSTDLFKTGTVFPPSVGGTQNESNDKTNASWNHQLEEALRSMESPKLAIPNSDGTISETSNIRVFNCKKLRYIWNEEEGVFKKLLGFDHAVTSNLHKSTGLSTFEQCQRRLIYGNNEIIVEVQSIVKLLFLEVLNPFYVFQIFSVTLWMSDSYYYYAGAIIIMSVFGITSTIIQTRQNQKKLKTTVQSSDIVTVARGNGVFEPVPTEHLVPGDLIVIPPHGCTMQCDAALLLGSCIVNESMLTGESVPVTKIALPNRSDVLYDAKEHGRHTLFCGTHVMQTRYYGNEKVVAVVLRSGFLTAKGSLVRSILYPPPIDYKFENDSYKFVAVLASVAFIGFVFSVYTKIAHREIVRNIIVDSLDLITIVVPPALPAAMTVGRFYAQMRLQKQGVYCISPRAINVSGSIDCVCFDKTGTLTEEGLDLWGVVPLKQSTSSSLNDLNGSKGRPTFDEPIREGPKLTHGSMMVGMAACHSLTRIDDNLIGDPLDLKMFEWVGWTLEEPGVADNEKFDILAPTIVRPRREVNDNVPEGSKQLFVVSVSRMIHRIGVTQLTTRRLHHVSYTPPVVWIIRDTETTKSYFEIGTEVGIVREFPFSSSLQRMSVITRTLGDSEYEMYCKGSPEMISSLALPQSIPKNFASTLESYTQKGYRVIAVGHKRLPKLNYAKVQRVMREELENELTFLGLIVMENRLKPETTGVMTVLKNAAIRTIMVTGDNMLTAISVARECGMLEASDKVIVLTTEESNDSMDRIPKVQYTFANKMDRKEMTTKDNSLTQSPQISILSGNDESTYAKNFIKNIEVEAPTTRYHFALTGLVFGIVRTYYPELLPKLLVRGTVFARMSPEQKQQLVEMLQALGYFVGMCGDGSNDCGALKAAHAGISLSDTESSVAAPFTSKEPNITCIPHLIREGRGALVTSFGIFKYMAVYSLTQFVSVIILYNISANLTDIEFLYIDLFLISVFAFFFGNSEPNPGQLVKTPPSASLVSASPIISILLHMIAIIAFQGFSLFYIMQQSWFTPYVHVEDSDTEYASYENYAIFTISSFQYIIMAIVYSRGKPHRKSLFTNPGLLISLITLTIFTIYLVLYPFTFLKETFRLLYLPPEFSFRLILIGFAFIQFLLALFIEYVIIDYILTQKIQKYIQSRHREKSKKEYIRIEYELSRQSNWPPISNTPSIDSVYISNEEGRSGQGQVTNEPVKSSTVFNNQHNKSLSLGVVIPPPPSTVDDERRRNGLSSSLPRPRRTRTISSNSYSSDSAQNNRNLQNTFNLPDIPPPSLP